MGHPFLSLKEGQWKPRQLSEFSKRGKATIEQILGSKEIKKS